MPSVRKRRLWLPKERCTAAGAIRWYWSTEASQTLTRIWRRVWAIMSVTRTAISPATALKDRTSALRWCTPTKFRAKRSKRNLTDGWISARPRVSPLSLRRAPPARLQILVSSLPEQDGGSWPWQLFLTNFQSIIIKILTKKPGVTDTHDVLNLLRGNFKYVLKESGTFLYIEPCFNKLTLT